MAKRQPPFLDDRLPFSGGCVVSNCPVASAIGLRVMRLGGNAVDAAVATGLALAVTYPQAGNLGGGGFMLIRKPGQGTEFLDYRETAPAGVIGQELADNPELAVYGHRSVGTPGTVDGLYRALTRHGTWSWEQVVSPALELAERGQWMTGRQGTQYQLYAGDFERFPSTRATLASDGGRPLAGTLYRQRDLAWTLRTLAKEGPRAFYEGEIAERIVDEMGRDGGYLSAEDLAGYTARWREPLHRTLFGKDVITASLPSGGGLVIHLALGLLQAMGVDQHKPGTAARHALLGEVFRTVSAVRRSIAGDPDHMTASELDEVHSILQSPLDAESLTELNRRFADDATPETDKPERRNTTHYCVVGEDGLAVSNTYTLNTLFGSKLIAAGTGFFLNNCMDDFRLAPGIANWYGLVEGDRCQLAPGRRPTGSMAPTIVLSRRPASKLSAVSDPLELILGASGGPRIPTAILQIIINTMVDRMPLPHAMLAPRVHHQFFPDALMVEDSIPLSVVRELHAMGTKVRREARLGVVVGIQRDPIRERVSTVLDPRFNTGLTL